jgi:hypothetical protein
MRLFAAIAVIGCAVWFVDEEPLVRTAALLIASAAGLGVVTESIFVWDRMNTIFKLYLQMWLLMACGTTLLVWEIVATATAARRRLAGARLRHFDCRRHVHERLPARLGLLREPRVEKHGPDPSTDSPISPREGASERQAVFEWF